MSGIGKRRRAARPVNWLSSTKILWEIFKWEKKINFQRLNTLIWQISWGEKLGCKENVRKTFSITIHNALVLALKSGEWRPGLSTDWVLQKKLWEILRGKKYFQGIILWFGNYLEGNNGVEGNNGDAKGFVAKTFRITIHNALSSCIEKRRMATRPVNWLSSEKNIVGNFWGEKNILAIITRWSMGMQRGWSQNQAGFSITIPS